MASQGASRLGPLPVLAGLLVIAGGVGLLRNRAPEGAAAACAPGEATCAAERESPGSAPGTTEAPLLHADEACHNVGYLCAELATQDRILVRHWKNFSGTIVVHVPRPDFEDAADALRLQQAAARGLRAWNGQPFAIVVDLRGDRNPNFAVQWTRLLSGNQIGVARTRWSSLTGLSVNAIELSTRNPYDATRVNDSRQVQLTAAHEMGHALGLPHSDSERDVMYPSNTATSMSAQDYHTMESLYALEDGTEIVR